MSQTFRIPRELKNDAPICTVDTIFKGPAPLESLVSSSTGVKRLRYFLGQELSPRLSSFRKNLLEL
jgi:hypothetical protein